MTTKLTAACHRVYNIIPVNVLKTATVRGTGKRYSIVVLKLLTDMNRSIGYWN